MTEEDEAFNEIERRAQQRKEAVKAVMGWTPKIEKTFDKDGMLISHTVQHTPNGAKESINPYRDQVIEEVAQHIEKMTGFGQDTLNSFAIYIRSLK